MKKIPTLFERDWDGNRSRVLDGPPKVDVSGALVTRKRDGTCVLVRAGKMCKRYDAKPGRTPPPDFELVEADETTGHRVGWVPVGDGPEDKWYRAAWNSIDPDGPPDDGTYELVGPKVQGNPEGYPHHALIRHGDESFVWPIATSYDSIRAFLELSTIEGIVWWRDGAPIAKIKRRDFGLPWPVK